MPVQDSTPEKIGGFRVIRRLATGGTSDVLLARAEGPHGFERVVVLKLLLAQFRDDASFERMFAREAAAYARLSHPAIVKLYDFFSADGQLVMVLEFVDGLPLNKLRALLRASVVASDGASMRPGSPLSADIDDRASLFIASRVYSALAAAHSARDAESGEFAPVIHRDVNPSNVLIPWDGHVKLADFGIAKVAGMQSDTKAGYIKGTYGYMAPEQVRGEAATPRTDVYAATLLLWELLARRKAIQRGALPDMEVLRAMAEPQLPSLDVLRPDLPAELREAVKRGLEPQPDQRAIFADELVAILRATANLDEGRTILVDALAAVRPPAAGEDLEKTQLRSTRASIQSFADTEVGERPSLPADTERVHSVTDPTLDAHPLPSFEGMPPPAPPARARPPQPQTLSFESPAPSRLPPRPAPRTVVGLGHTMPMAGPANGTPPAPRTPLPPASQGPQSATKTLPLMHPSYPGQPPMPAIAPMPAPRFELPSFPAPPPPSIGTPPPPVVASRPPPVTIAMMGTPPPVASALHTPPPPPVRPASMSPGAIPFDLEPDAVPRPPSRAGVWLLGAAVGFVVMCVVIVAGLLFLRWRAEPPPTAAATSSAPRPSTTPPPPSPSPSPPPSPSPSKPAPSTTPPAPPPPPAAPASTAGDIDTATARPQHRVFVDGRVVGETPGTFHVPCGAHQVKLGSQGKLQNVDVPCGGVLKMSDR